MTYLPPISADRVVQRTILKNGMRIVTERMPFVRSVALGVWVRAGSSDESLENNGIAHFLEHMLFKGTTSRTAKDIARSLESLGGGIDGSTGKEITLYNAYVLDEHLDIAIDVLADVLQHPRFDDTDIALERQVILAEIMHAQEDPEEFTFDTFYQNMFPRHPLGYFIIGSKENIRKFGKVELEHFKKSHYTPDRMVFAAAGNLQHERCVAAVQNYFADEIDHKPKRATSPMLVNVEPMIRRRIKTFQQAHICLGVRTFGQGDDRRYTLAFLDALLGGGMSSRLFQNIREKYGFAYSVFSFSDLMAETGVFGAYMACEKSKIDESISLMQNEIDKIKQGDLTVEEVDGVKSQLKGNLLLGLESSSRRMKRIGETEMYGREHHSPETIVELINNISKSDIESMTQELFISANTSITVLSP